MRSNISARFRLMWCFLVSVLPGLLSPGLIGASGDQNWDARFGSLPPGTDGAVYSLLTVGENIYAGGAFIRAGGVPSPGIARYDGTNWHDVGGGVNGEVASLARYGSSVVVGGSFDRAGDVAATNIALWTGTQWQAIGNTERPLEPDTPPIYPDAKVNVVWSDGSDLYVGGLFYSVGGVVATNIAKWDGIEWSALGSGLALPGFAIVYPPLGEVFGICRFGNKLYAGGLFTHAGETAVSHIAVWNGENWEPLDSGMSGGAMSVHSWNDENVYGRVSWVSGLEDGLYVSGDFTSAGSVAATNLAKWNGTNWEAVNHPGTTEFVGIARGNGDQLFLHGRFQFEGDPAAYGLLEYKDDEWVPDAPDAAGWISCVERFGDDLYAGGYFSSVAGLDTAYIARQTAEGWNTIGTGAGSLLLSSRNVRCLAADSQYLYAGGWGFFGAGKSYRSMVARWDGSNWTSLLPLSVWSSVSQMLFVGDRLFVAGEFTLPEIGATNLVCWDGTSWSALEPLDYFSGWPETLLATDGSVLYVAGAFTNAGGIEVRGLAQWDGDQWSSVGDPFWHPWWYDNTIEALMADSESGNLYVAVSGQTPRILQWDGSDWSELPGAFSGTDYWASIRKMVMREDELIVAGRFSQVGDIPVTRIARWNGYEWDGLGNPFDDDATILDMAVIGTNLYVARTFAKSSVSAQAIIKWDGQQWTALGNGVHDHLQRSGRPGVLALAVQDRKLYMAGYFDQAGRYARSGFALWHELPAIRLHPLSSEAGNTVLRADGMAGLPFVLETSPDLRNWFPHRSGNFETDSVVFDIEKNSDAAYFRLLVEP